MKNVINNWLVGIVLILFSCNIWDLEKFEISNFDVNIGEIGLGQNPKNDFLQIENNNYLMVGTTQDSLILIREISEDGLLLKNFANYGRGSAHAILRTTDTERPFVVVGSSDSDMFVLWIDGEGNKIQLDTFKNIINEIIGLVLEVAAFDIAETASNELIITGYVRQSIGERRLMWMKLSQDGILIEFRLLINDAYGMSILPTKDNSVLISGFHQGKLMLSKINNSGTEMWQRIYSNTISNGLTNIVEHFNGNYVLIGTSKFSNENIYVLEVNENGNILWEKEYGTNNGIDAGVDIIRTRDSSFVFIATSTSAELDEIILSKIDYFGERIWTRIFAATDLVDLYAVKQVGDLGFSILGLSQFNNDYMHRFIKTDEEGEYR